MNIWTGKSYSRDVFLRLLTLEHKNNRMTTSKEWLAMLSCNSSEFLCRFVTVDDTWIHHNTPETKEQSRPLVFGRERAPKKAKMVTLPTKSRQQFFWDARGVIFIDYLEKGKKSTQNIIRSFWTDSISIWRKNDRKWRRKKFCFIKTMQGCTPV